jgi:hypothetical protein
MGQKHRYPFSTKGKLHYKLEKVIANYTHKYNVFYSNEQYRNLKPPRFPALQNDSL